MQMLMKRIENHKIMIFILVSILTFVIYGVGTWQYLVYNLDGYLQLVHPDSFKYDPIVQLSNSSAYVLSWFMVTFRWFLQIPAAFIICSIVIKTIIFWLAYKIAGLLVGDSFIAFIGSLYFILSGSYDTHGVVLNGMWGSPLFFYASVSALFTLAGIYLCLKNRFIISSICFAASLHFHILYGTTALAFFLPGYFIYYFTVGNNSNFRPLLLPGVLICVNLAFIVYSRMSMDLPGIPSTIVQWYTYVYSVDPDDMSLFYTLGNHGFFLLLLLATAFWIACKKETDNNLRHLFLGGTLFLAFSLIVELLHRNGLFFGKLSELFIGLQLRRGIWVLMFFALLLILKQVDSLIQNIKKKESNAGLNYRVLIASFLCLYLVSDWIAVGLFCILFIILRPGTKSIGLAAIFLISMIIYFSWNEFQAISFPIKKFAYYGLVAAAIVFGLYYWQGLNRKILFLFPLAVFVFTATGAGLAQQRLLSGVQLIANNGFFSYPDHQKLSVDVYFNQGYNFNNKLIHAVRKNNPQHLPILIPPNDITYGDRFIYNCPIYISRWNIALPMFSKQIFGYLLYKIKEMGLIVSSDDLHPSDGHFYTKNALLDFLTQGTNKLSGKELRHLSKRHHICLVLSRTEHLELVPVFQNNGYYLYKMNEMGRQFDCLGAKETRDVIHND